MVLNIVVSPRASRVKIDRINEDKRKGSLSLKVYLTKPAFEGEANKQLIGLLADYFKTGKSRIKIIKGEKARIKVVEITE